MSSLLQSPTCGDKYNQARVPTRKEVNPVSHRHRMVLDLHLSGHQVKEIQDLTGYAESTIYDILSQEEVVALRQQIMHVYDKEFEMLFPKVIQSIRMGLEPTKDIKDQLSAAKLWLKAHGKGGVKIEKGGDTYNLTAEDVVFQILNGNYVGPNANAK